MSPDNQPDLFTNGPSLPEGFRYGANLIQPDQEQALLEEIRRLPFKEFEFHGFLGKRRVVSFGWRYDFNGGGLRKTEDMPNFLMAVRDKAGAFAGIAPADDPQFVVVVTLARPDTMKTSAAAAPTFRSIMTQVLKTFRVPPSTQPPPRLPLTW